MKITYDTDTPPSTDARAGATIPENYMLLGERFERYVRLIHLDAPPQIVENEERMIAASLGVLAHARADDTDLIDAEDWKKHYEKWRDKIKSSRELDPIIRESLRPVVERLASDAPDTAEVFAFALICRALRMLDASFGLEACREDICEAALIEVSVNPELRG